MLKLFKTEKRIRDLYDNVKVKDYLPQYSISINKKRSMKPVIITVPILIICIIGISMLLPFFSVDNNSVISIKIGGLSYFIPFNNQKIEEYNLPRSISTDMLGEKIGIMNSNNFHSQEIEESELPGRLLGKGIYRCKGKEFNVVLIIGDEDVGYYYFLFSDNLFYSTADNMELKNYSMRNTFELFGCYNYTDIAYIESYTVTDNKRDKKVGTLKDKTEIENFYNIIISLEAMKMDNAFSRHEENNDLTDIKHFKIFLNNGLNLYLKLEKNHMFRSYAYYDATNVEDALNKLYNKG